MIPIELLEDCHENALNKVISGLSGRESLIGSISALR